MENQFSLLEAADKLKWEKAVVNDLDSILITEVPLKLKDHYFAKVADNEKLNIEHRLLIFKERNSFYSLMEYFISEKDLEYLQDLNKNKYSKKESGFDGIVVLTNSCNEVISTEWITKKTKSGEVKLKSSSASGYCVYLGYWYEDGHFEPVSLMFCVLPYLDSSNGTSGGSSGDGSASTPEATEDNCNCDVCPVCGGCNTEPTVSSSTSNSNIPDGDAIYDEVTYNCPMCSCPKIETTSAFADNEKVMCIYSNLIGTAVRSYNTLVTTFLTNFSDRLSTNPGDITFNIKNLGTSKYGQCIKNGDNFEVTLNSNFIDNRSPIEIAKTLIHEILHAKIGHDLNLSPNVFVDDFAQYINNGTLNQHDLMMDYYVEPMINFLKDYDNLCGLMAPNDDYYRSLALSGLESVITVQEMKDLTKAQNYFRNRGLNCN